MEAIAATKAERRRGDGSASDANGHPATVWARPEAWKSQVAGARIRWH